MKDQIDILYKELKPIKSDLYHKTTTAKAITAELDVLEGQKKSEEGAVSVQKTPEDIKKEFDEKIKAVEEKRDKLEDRIDDYMDKHVRENDSYEDQQDLLHYINWVTNQIAWLKKRKEHEEKRKLHYARIVREGKIYAQPFSEGGAAAATRWLMTWPVPGFIRAPLAVPADPAVASSSAASVWGTRPRRC